MRRWDGGLQRIAIAHIVSWLACALGITGIDMAVNGAAFSGDGFTTYAFPQAVWLLFDIVRWLRARPAAKTGQISN
jgi:hypothetical protein